MTINLCLAENLQKTSSEISMIFKAFKMTWKPKIDIWESQVGCLTKKLVDFSLACGWMEGTFGFCMLASKSFKEIQWRFSYWNRCLKSPTTTTWGWVLKPMVNNGINYRSLKLVNRRISEPSTVRKAFFGIESPGHPCSEIARIAPPPKRKRVVDS